MSIKNLKQSWQASFDKSIASVEQYLAPSTPYYPEAANFRLFANWLVKNDCNSYDYMPRGYQNFLSTPFETEYLLATLHHALCDDGEVSFVKMKIEDDVRRVFMIFVWKNEDSFDAICRKENESLINSYIKGRESQRRVMTSMQEKHPEKTFNVRPIISEKDITFEAHNDPVLFIKEVEEFQMLEKQRIQEFDEKMSKLRKVKP